MSSDRQQTSDDWDAMVKASHTLTREQVEEEAVSLNDLPAYITAPKSTITAQRQALAKEPLHEGECLSCMKLADTLAQQAQEVERLTLANEMLKGCVMEVDRTLAAMTAERDVMRNSREALVETVKELRDTIAKLAAENEELSTGTAYTKSEVQTVAKRLIQQEKDGLKNVQYIMALQDLITLFDRETA